MAFYKECDCGHRSFFDHPTKAPRKCDACGRSLLGKRTLEEQPEQEKPEQEKPSAPVEEHNAAERPEFYFSLDAVDGSGSIVIPPEGGTVGRACLGAGLLADTRSVSRTHLNVRYQGHIGLIVEDISRYGTFFNGKLLEKETPQFVREGDILRLYSFELRVTGHRGA